MAVILLSLLIILVLPPLVLIRHFLVTAIFSISCRHLKFVPLIDALISKPGTSNYGKIRVIGSIGLFLTLLLQFTSL